MGVFKKLFALPKSPGLKVIALLMYGFIALLVLGSLINLIGGM